MRTRAPEAARLVSTLKRALKAAGLSYARVAQALGLSESSVKRVFSEHTFTLERLEAICGLLGMSVYELTRLAQETAEEVQELSLAQERTLAEDPMLLTYFYMLLNGWTPDQVKKDFGISDRRSGRYLHELERHGFIQIPPSGRPRVLVSQHITWRPGGPIRQRYEEFIRHDFLDAAFDGPSEAFRYTSGELSEASCAVIGRKVEALVREMEDLARLDRMLPPESKRNMGMVVGFRAWVFEVVDQLRRQGPKRRGVLRRARPAV